MSEVFSMSEKMSMISQIALKKPGLGKTAMMKLIFLLEEVYRVPLEYEYEIYTYGPYCSEVADDVEIANLSGYLAITVEEFSSGHIGYHLDPTDKAKELVDLEKDFLLRYNKEFLEVMDLFSEKTVKELELLTTIVYLYSNYRKNNWAFSENEIIDDVNAIKPHFDKDKISKAYNVLEENRIFDKLNGHN